MTTQDDVFDLYDGLISLREAVYYAPTRSPSGAITFDSDLGAKTITLAGTSLWIDKAVVIDASSLTSLTIDANTGSRVLSVITCDENAAELHHLIITGGSTFYGGGIYNVGALMLMDCAIVGNWASKYGGGVYNYGTLKMVNTSLLANSAHRYGGAVTNGRDSMLTITNGTLAGNLANVGGGVDNYGTLRLQNSIVAGNASSSDTPDIRHTAGLLSGSYNLIGDGSSQNRLIDGRYGNLVGTAENPIDPLFLRPPSDGGDGWGDDPDTPDIDESANDDYGDLRLRPDSPAVDAGDNALLPEDTLDLDADGDTAEPIPFDLAGNARVSGAAVDMGAYECFCRVGSPGGFE